MKKILWMAFVLLMFTTGSYANEYMITVDGAPVDYDAVVYTQDEGYIAPVAVIAKASGYSVNWYPNSKILVASRDRDDVTFCIEDEMMYVSTQGNPEQAIPIPSQLVLMDGRYYASIHFLSHLFAFDFSTDDELYTFDVESDWHDQVEVKPLQIAYTKDELLTLAKLLFYEARDGSVVKDVAVGNVVVNRVKSDYFPDSIEEVIFAKGQFPPAYYDSFETREPTNKSMHGAIRALYGEQVADDCLYFNMVPFAWKASDFYKNIEGDYFYH